MGALIGAGIPEERARLQGKALKRGGIVMGGHPRSEGDASPVEREWTNHRGEHLYR